MPVQKTNLSEKDYAQLGRAIEKIIRKDYVDLALNKRRLWFIGFTKGMATGLGGVLGATILITLLAWILSWFDTVPIIGELLQHTRDTIQR